MSQNIFGRAWSAVKSLGTPKVGGRPHEPAENGSDSSLTLGTDATSYAPVPMNLTFGAELREATMRQEAEMPASGAAQQYAHGASVAQPMHYSTPAMMHREAEMPASSATQQYAHQGTDTIRVLLAKG